MSAGWDGGEMSGRSIRCAGDGGWGKLEVGGGEAVLYQYSRRSAHLWTLVSVRGASKQGGTNGGGIRAGRVDAPSRKLPGFLAEVVASTPLLLSRSLRERM